MMAAAPTPLSAPTLRQRRPSIAVLAGATLDPAAGPDQLLAGAGTLWKVTPKRRAVVFTLRFGTPTRVHRMQLAASSTGPNRIEAVDVSSQAAPDEADWTWANYCKASGLRGDCSFLARTVSALRILVKTSTDDPLALGDLAVE